MRPGLDPMLSPYLVKLLRGIAVKAIRYIEG
jgi:hypothetical protein